jgi:nucleotide-binding universal stress UspA family protein
VTTSLRRPHPRDFTGLRRSSARPVLLATLGVPFERAAATFAVDSAVEAGQPLIVVNAVEILLAPASLMLGYGDVDAASPEDEAALHAPAQLAHALGVRVERLRLRSPHPVEALLDLAREREPGLLVFGPDRARMRARRYRRAARAVRERAGCLVWLPD